MAKASTNKKSHAGRNVLVFFIVFIILEMLIVFGIGKVFKNPDVTPSIAGYSLYMTKSELKMKDDTGAMVTAIPKDVLIIAANGVTDARSKIGNAVLCERVPGVESGVFWLYSVEARENQDGVFYRVWDGYTYYDLRSTNVVGFTGSYFETAGKVIKFVTNKFGMIVCAVVPVFLLVLLELIIAIATHTPEEYEEDEDEEEFMPRHTDREVKLDDFLFGGQSEGEQIARHRREQAEGVDGATREREPVRGDLSLQTKAPDPVQEHILEEKIEPKTVEKPAMPEHPDLSLGSVEPAPAPKEEPAPQEPLSLKDEEPAEPAAPAPARRQGQARRRPARLTGGTARQSMEKVSLEELSRLIEEEQAKLRDQLK